MIKVPVILKVAILTVLATAFYTYVGQLVPQKEVLPPAEIEIDANMTTEQMVEVGLKVMEEKGLCFTCHTVGQSGALRFPDLAGIGARAGTQIEGMTDVEYLAQSLYEPDVYVLPGFNPGMPAMNKPPIDLTDQEILAHIAKLQSMGGTPTVTMETKLVYTGGDAPAAPPEEEGVGAPTGTEAPKGEEAAAAPSEALVAFNGAELFQQLRCVECHSLTPVDESDPAQKDLIELEPGLDRVEVFSKIMYPAVEMAEGLRKKEMLEEAGLYDQLTIHEIKALVDFLAEREPVE